ncbi:MAG TPA: uroporphyrinogen-III C-methyltransferase [Candidatus Binatia bacterium]|nr:uroporphyrinogen-III C-methyltransferase [Candidatus Binatia bacterium]
MARSWVGKVYLIGAGPGDPELMTLKGKRCLRAADAILYDALVSRELLGFTARDAELIDVGKRHGRCGIGQREIEAMLIERARAGQYVVRLKGGDPFVFGRGGEEAEALRRAGIPFEIVPGVSSAIAVPACAGIPVTHRDYASSVAFVTGHKVSKQEVKWGELSRACDTLVVLMGLHNLGAIMNRLLAEGCPGDRPVALIESGTLPEQKMAIGTVTTISDIAARRHFQSPSLIVIGNVVNLAGDLSLLGNRSL